MENNENKDAKSQIDVVFPVADEEALLENPTILDPVFLSPT